MSIGIITRLGNLLSSLTITSISRTYSDSTSGGRRGDPTESTTTYSVSAVVQIMTGEEDLVKEGLLKVGDVWGVIDGADTNAAYVTEGNTFSWQSNTYKITKVIKGCIFGSTVETIEFYASKQ